MYDAVHCCGGFFPCDLQKSHPMAAPLHRRCIAAAAAAAKNSGGRYSRKNNVAKGEAFLE
jgi:hypothetical protein